jgi:hypothetical protein
MHPSTIRYVLVANLLEYAKFNSVCAWRMTSDHTVRVISGNWVNKLAFG